MVENASLEVAGTCFGSFCVLLCSDATVLSWLKHYAKEFSRTGTVHLGLRLQQEVLDMYRDSTLAASSSTDADTDESQAEGLNAKERRRAKRAQAHAAKLRNAMLPVARTPAQLLELETQHKILDLYIWLGHRQVLIADP